MRNVRQRVRKTVAGRSVRIHAEPVPGMRPILHLKQFHATNDHYGLSALEAAASAVDLHIMSGASPARHRLAVERRAGGTQGG